MGFSWVGGEPDHEGSGPAGSWVVCAVDGPYPSGSDAYELMEKASRLATREAKTFGGTETGLEIKSWDGRGLLRLRDPRFVLERPGAFPTSETSMRGRQPVAADLSAGLDGRGPAGEALLAGLDEIDWDALAGPYEGGPTVRRFLEGLAMTDGDHWNDEVADDLYAVPIHQGTCYQTTGPATTFIAQVFRAGGLPHRLRLELLGWLLYAGDREGHTALLDAPRARAEGRPARPDAWTSAARGAVRAEVAGLLSRWDDEPVAIRFVLAALAGQFPDQAGGAEHKVARLASALKGTSHGAVLRIAVALLTGDAAAAAAKAQDVARWDPPTDDIDPDDGPPGVVAAHVMAVAAASLPK